jgi:hypothetical protein
MRLIMFGGMAIGVGGTILAFSLIFKDVRLFYASLIPLALVLVMAFVDTFLREKVGYIHPVDLAFSNILAYLYTLSQILILGYFRPELQDLVYDIGTIFLMSFIFLVGFVKIGLMRTFEIDEKDRPKEATARFVLLSMIFGALMAVARIGFDFIYRPPPSGLGLGFGYSAIVLAASTAALMLLTGIVIRGKYEPISKKREKRD